MRSSFRPIPAPGDQSPLALPFWTAAKMPVRLYVSGAWSGGNSLYDMSSFVQRSCPIGCIQAVQPMCAEAEEGASRLSVGPGMGKAVTWRWRGEGPDASAGVTLCVFREPDDWHPLGLVELALRTGSDASCAADGCWRGGRRGLRYSSRADGLTRISWWNGRPGKDRIHVRARGASIWENGGAPSGLPLLVQLSDGAGGCWQSRETVALE